MTTSLYRLRPGRLFDLPAVVRVYMASFDHEPLLDHMFPTRHTDDAVYYTWNYRRFQARFWSLEHSLTVVVDGSDRPVAFSWWERPAESLTLKERLLSPFSWLCPLVQAYFSVRDYLFPLPGCDPVRLDIYYRTFNAIKPSVLNTPRRREAWYMSNIGVDPALQAKGLGTMLVRDGLQKADQKGVATWLCGLKGLEHYYNRFGYVEVARANVGELKDWEGGSIMFRE